MAKKKKTKELPIPPDVVEDPGSIEMIRVWIAKHGLHVSLKIGDWREQSVGEEKAWGIMLSDVIRHVANAIHEREGRDRDDTIRTIKRELDAELDEPTSSHRGRFVEPLPNDKDS